MLENNNTQYTDKLIYHTNIPYAFTLNFNDQFQYFKYPDEIDRIKKVRNIMYDNFIIDFQGEIRSILEISEPIGDIHPNTHGPRLHYHGIIIFKRKRDICNFLVSKMRHMLHIGKLKINTIVDLDGWIKYMSKQNIIPNKLKYLSNISDPNSPEGNKLNEI